MLLFMVRIRIKEAILRENEIKLQLKSNTYINKSKITLKQLILEWLKSYKDYAEDLYNREEFKKQKKI